VTDDAFLDASLPSKRSENVLRFTFHALDAGGRMRKNV